MKTQKRHLIILSLLLTLLGCCNMAQAKNIYWNPDAANDNNNGTTEALAVKTFAKAKSLVTSASDWIILLKTYTLTADETFDGSKGTYNVSVQRKVGLTATRHMFSVPTGYTLTLQNITIAGGFNADVQTYTGANPSEMNALINMSRGSEVVLKAGAILKDNWTSFGPAIKNYDGGTVRMEGGEITNCGTYNYGGAIAMFSYYETSYFYMSGGKIHNCYAANGGGAFGYRNYSNGSTVLSGSMTIEMSGGEISDCKVGDETAYGGGAFYLNSDKVIGSQTTVSFTMTDGTIKDCTAPKGGALFVTGKNTLYLNGGTIDNCEATGTKYTTTSGGSTTTHYYKSMGGAIYMVTNTEATTEQNSSISMGGTTIQKCEADSIGGGIYMRNLNDNSTVTMTMNAGSTIDQCSSTNYNGGGVYMAGKATFNMNGGKIQNCAGLNGAGVFMTSVDYDATASFTMGEGAVINNCTATHDGGGVYMNKQAVFTMNGGEIGYCHSTRNGGGVAVVGDDGDHLNSVYVYGGEIHHCDALNPSAHCNGAGFHVYYSNMLIDGATVLIHDNECDAYGGGINVQYGNLTINDGKIYNNRILSWSEGSGGAIHFSRAHEFIMTGGEIYGNSSVGSGGAFHASYVNGAGDYMRISGGKIYNNTAVIKGGAFNINTGSLLEFVAGSGGQSVEMYGNKSCRGGAVAIDGGLLNIEAGSFHDNEADATLDASVSDYKGYGGAFLVMTQSTANTTSGKLDISGGEFYNNVASQDGGVIYLQHEIYDVAGDEPSVTISGGTIHNNTATNGNGGGIYYDLNTKMYVDNGSMMVKDNTAQGRPNNVYIRTGNVIDINSGATFSPDYVGVYTENRTPNIPVFRGTNTQVSAIYTGMTTVDPATNLAVMNVYDDSQEFSPIDPGSGLILYFGDGSLWSPLQQTVRKTTDLDPILHGDVYEISNVKQLTAFLWYVNGIDDHDVNFSATHAGAKGKLTADINMEGHYWVPIANYTGTFDGNGYVISHLTMVPSNVESERGLFGVNSSGTIKNVNLRDGYFGGGGSYIGTVVSQMNGGTLYNSVAQCQMLATAETTTAGGLVGYINGGTVHSSIATCEMTGYTMGGLAGEINSSGNLYNSFANPLFSYTTPADPEDAYFVGGLVADNAGTVANCYVRFSRTQSLTGAKFGQLVGNNDGTVNPCYTPEVFTSDVPSTIVHTGSATSDTYKVVDAPYLYNRPNDNLVGSTGKTLTEKLNNWIPNNSDYAPWRRTTAGGYSYIYDEVNYTGGNINDDYPMPKMKELSNVASTDGFYFDYAPSLVRTLIKYNGLTGGGTVWLYDSPRDSSGDAEEVNVDNDSDVLLYIDEDATLLQADGNTLQAYTSQTLHNYASNANRWHNVSSSLTQSGIGFDYNNNGQGQHADFNWSTNPCNIALSGDNDNAFFPSDLPWPETAEMDFYCFYEPEYHWINLKRRTDSHYHMNATTVPIVYNGNGIGAGTNGNETYMVPGKGYLVSIDKDQLIQNKGELNNGTVTLYSVTKTDRNAWAGLLGFNLLGNPYQSYLDFEAFVNADIDPSEATAKNADNLWTGGDDDTYANTYATFDPEQNAYRQYFADVSSGAKVASRYIHPHQGFFIRKTAANSGDNTVTFTNAMRTNTTDGQSGFRGAGQPSHALVNFVVRDAQGNGDIAVLELNRDGDEGAAKIRMGDGAGHVSLGYEGKAYAILFRTKVDGYQPLWFEATEAGTFTLGWNIHNAVFESLTLVDNIAGTSTDMLATDSYTFQGSPDHYASRFKVVIGDYVEVDPDAPVEPEPVEGPTFAFIVGDELVVDGEGTLQVFDVMGRQLSSTTLSGTRSTVGLPTAATGVYVLRLTSENGMKVQKIVVGH